MIFEPRTPRMWRTASWRSIPFVLWHGSAQSFGTSVGQIATTWSRAFSPARAAGVPAIGATTSMNPSRRFVISMPSPWNSPRVSTCISRCDSGSRYEEWGSRSARSPRTAPRTSFVSSTSST